MLNITTLFCQNDIFIAWKGLFYFKITTNKILDIKEAFSGYKQGTTLGFTKEVNLWFWPKKLKICFLFLLVKIDLYIMFGNILRYSEILGLLGLIRTKKKIQSFDQIHGLSLWRNTWRTIDLRFLYIVHRCRVFPTQT